MLYSKFYILIGYRSQSQLQNLGDQLSLDAVGGGNKEEDSSINVVSDGENTNNHAVSPQDELHAHDSQIMKLPDLNQAAHEELQPHGTSLNRLTKFYMINQGGGGAGAFTCLCLTC